MIKKKRHNRKIAGLEIFVGIMLALFTWTFYNFLSRGIGDILLMANITNPYIQDGIVLSILGSILLVLGYKIWKNLAD